MSSAYYNTNHPDIVPHPYIRLVSVCRQILPYLLLVVVLYSLVNLLTVRFVVEGSSMEPTINNGQFLVVSRISYRFTGPQRGDIVVFHAPLDASRDYIKRVIGLPGDVVELRQGRVYINGSVLSEPYIVKPCLKTICSSSIWQVAADAYFVLGDNRNSSRDSRVFGAIPKEQIVGEVVLRYWPISEMRWLHQIGLPQ